MFESRNRNQLETLHVPIFFQVNQYWEVCGWWTFPKTIHFKSTNQIQAKANQPSKTIQLKATSQIQPTKCNQPIHLKTDQPSIGNLKRRQR